MKKLILLFSLVSVFFFTAQSQTLLVDGVNYSVDTLENHQVGPGTQYVALRLLATNRLDVYFLKTDLKNPHIQVRTALGQDSIYSGERPSALAKRKSTEGAFYFAGTNGDFYNTTGYVGYPIGGSMVENEIAKTPIDWNAFVIDDQKIPDIGKVSYSGSVKTESSEWTINTVNHLRNENSLVLYNRHNGLYTRTNAYGTEVLIQLLEGTSWATNRPLKAKVLKVAKGVGSMAIPKGQAVLSGHGTAAEFLNNLKENDAIEINLNLTVNSNSTSNFTQMTGGDSYATMLKDGAIEEANVWNERHPRTAIGYSQNKDTLIMCVVDGRGLSAGVTTKQLAFLMKSAGAYTAFNMDGGGSTSMYVAEYNGPVNKNSDPGGERAVSNSIFVVSTAPTDNAITEIKPHETSTSLPYLGEYIPKFYAYNQYGTLISSDLQGVVLSCPPSLGTISGNKLIASGNTPGKLTATYNGNVVTTIDINFLPVSAIKIRLDTVLIDNRSEYPIEVLASTSAGDALISAAAFNWVVENPEICKVENGLVKALKNGMTKLTGSIDGVTDDLIVKVEIPAAATITGDSILQKEWTMTASSFLNAKLSNENLPESWTTGSAVNFVYAIGRAPFIKLAHKKTFYGLPDTVKLVMNLGDIAMSKAIVTLQNNLGNNVTTEFTAFKQNTDFSLDIPVDKIFSASDKAIYPVKFDNVNFYLDAAKMTTTKAYTLAFKEITLCYKDYIISYLASEKSDFFGIYPNPIENGETLKVNFMSGILSDNLRFQLFDLSGRLIKSDILSKTNSSEAQISLKGVGTGTYLLQISYDTKHQSVKIVVK